MNLGNKHSQEFMLNISCSLFPGQCTGLLGHNGSGKTTTFKILMGLTQADRGEIYFHGEKAQSHHKKNIGYMSEENRFPQEFTVKEIFYFQSVRMNLSASNKKIIRENIENQLHKSQLWPKRSHRISQLSKGVLQKLSWNLATIHHPQILILDEPFSGLDPLEKGKLSAEIHKRKLAGQTIIISSHELDNILPLSDQIIILKEGKMIPLANQSIKKSDLLSHYERVDAKGNS